MHSASATGADENETIELAGVHARLDEVARLVPKERGLQRRDRVGRVRVAVLVEHVLGYERLDEPQRTSASRVVAVDHATFAERCPKRLTVANLRVGDVLEQFLAVLVLLRSAALL